MFVSHSMQWGLFPGMSVCHAHDTLHVMARAKMFWTQAWNRCWIQVKLVQTCATEAQAKRKVSGRVPWILMTRKCTELLHNNWYAVNCGLVVHKNALTPVSVNASFTFIGVVGLHVKLDDANCTFTWIGIPHNSPNLPQRFSSHGHPASGLCLARSWWFVLWISVNSYCINPRIRVCIKL